MKAKCGVCLKDHPQAQRIWRCTKCKAIVCYDTLRAGKTRDGLEHVTKRGKRCGPVLDPIAYTLKVAA